MATFVTIAVNLFQRETVGQIGEVDHFTYMGCVVDIQGGTKADVKAGIGKARVAFLQLKNIWNSSILLLKKIVTPGLSIQMAKLFFAETCKTTVTTTKRI